jgi:L-ascorbate metabolism protein UlaG (beta-lactamase superfamily)
MDASRRPRHRGKSLLAAGAAGFALLALDAPSQNVHYDAANRHHTPTGFRNNYPHDPPANFLAWQWERWTKGVPQEPANGWNFPVDKPDAALLKVNRTTDTVTWIGHATVLLQLSGVNILTDPHFTERASPFGLLGPKRVVPPALALDELPHIDVVLLSHNHYDHLDEATVKALAEQQGGPPRFYVPLGVKAWFEERGLPVHAEMDWWERKDDGPLAIHFVPAQHWSARTLGDRNATLWGGFVVEKNGYRFIYTGDTGYSQDFRDIGERFGGFDLAAIPIGSYAPRWFMAAQHVDPAEAVRIHQDLRATQSLGVHWGTFVLTDEPLDEPPLKLRQALQASAIPSESFWVFRHGEMRRLDAGRPQIARAAD